MASNVARKLIADHLLEGKMEPGEEIAIRIDQTLTQDATGTMVMLEFEALGGGRVKTELSAQYVDHNLLQTDWKNADDHVFLRSACEKFGVWYSRPGNGVSHPVHMERFGIPGKTLIGSDSHTCAAGSLGMLAIGAGGLKVALAMAGEPFYLHMPRIWGIRLSGRLPDWVSAKDVILEMLRRHGVDGGHGRIIEFYGPGLEELSAMDRHVIANMGAELGATTTVFPADEAVRRFLAQQEREDDYVELLADKDAGYDDHDEIDLASLEPLIACPSSPGNVVPVSEVAGRPVFQAYIGSSANPGLRDFAVPAMMVDGRSTSERVSFDINPTSRQILEILTESGHLGRLIRAGARIHQAGCNGCIGMGQAPATGRNSLRTVPRTFPGRSGTDEDSVYLCSPETATAAALTGQITDPRELDMDYPRFSEPKRVSVNRAMLTAPAGDGAGVELEKGPNVVSLPEFDALPDHLELKVLLKMGDDVSTDEIMPAGSRVLPYRSNIPEISKFVFERIEKGFHGRAMEHRARGWAVVAGRNYGQGSSREHAALAPRYLGLRVVVAKSIARIHWQNLPDFGIVPLGFVDEADYDRLEAGDMLVFNGLGESLKSGDEIVARTGDREIPLRHSLSPRQIETILAGGRLNQVRSRQSA